MIAMSLMPPTYLDPEGRWYKVWLERLERSEPWMLPWPNHREYATSTGARKPWRSSRSRCRRS
jgi:hypothetical protein